MLIIKLEFRTFWLIIRSSTIRPTTNYCLFFSFELHDRMHRVRHAHGSHVFPYLVQDIDAYIFVPKKGFHGLHLSVRYKTIKITNVKHKIRASPGDFETMSKILKGTLL